MGQLSFIDIWWFIICSKLDYKIEHLKHIKVKSYLIYNYYDKNNLIVKTFKKVNVIEKRFSLIT